jgi:hypothetical protein
MLMALMTTPRARSLGLQALTPAADWMAVGVAVSLPWSTTATGIFIVLWLLAVLATLDVIALRREVMTAAGGLPVLLWLLAVAGMLWADVTWNESFNGLAGFHRLLAIPLLLAQFRRSERGMWVLCGYFAAVLCVLLVSWALVLLPGLPWRGKQYGVPVKDYLNQAESFLICAFVLLGRACGGVRRMKAGPALALVAIAALFLADIVFVATGRTVLLIAPVLMLLLGWRQYGWKGLLAAGALGCIAAVAIWLSSPYLRDRMETSVHDLQAFDTGDAVTSTALHLEFLSKSLSFVAAAPIIGHGTGSIPEQFRQAATGQTGVQSVGSDNPHNQIFAVAIQLGLVGAAVLAAMWIAHVMLFRGGGIIAWIGTIVVVQNVVASLFNSHLFDFGQGWLYVFGVGVVGGMTLREQDTARARAMP